MHVRRLQHCDVSQHCSIRWCPYRKRYIIALKVCERSQKMMYDFERSSSHNQRISGHLLPKLLCFPFCMKWSVNVCNFSCCSLPPPATTITTTNFAEEQWGKTWFLCVAVATSITTTNTTVVAAAAASSRPELEQTIANASHGFRIFGCAMCVAFLW